MAPTVVVTDIPKPRPFPTHSMGVGRLANKAAVGLACRLHGRTLALVTAHFAADKHGKERAGRRACATQRASSGS